MIYGKMYICIILVSLSIVYGSPIRPQYPPQFVSNWTYALRGPEGDVSSGWTLWAGGNDTLYYYMSAFGGWEQVVKGTTIYNFYREKKDCCQDNYGWDIVPHYFDHATLINPGDNPLWVGSLYTQRVFGVNGTYIVRTEGKSGYPIEYVAANVVEHDQSEVMARSTISYEAPNPTLITVPDFCVDAAPCAHSRVPFTSA